MRRGAAGRGAAALAAVLLWPLATPAVAHQAAPTLTPVIDGFSPDVDGVRVTVQASQDATLLAIQPATGVLVEVLDTDGRAWARITSSRVEADVTAPAFHAGTSPNGVVPDPLPTSQDPWPVVGRDGRFQWFEHSLHPAELDVAPEVLASDTAQDVATWSVPLRVDGQDVVLQGRLRHVPVTGRVEPRLHTPREIAPGVAVEVAAGPVPVLFLRNGSDVRVTVLSRGGAPYVVLDAEGAVVNVASATWVEQRRFEGSTGAVPDGPEFQRLSATSSHSWLDTRAALPGLVPDEEVRAGGREVTLQQWAIPVEVDGQLQQIEGESVWVPLAAGVDPPWLPAERLQYVVAVAAALVLVGVWVWRRRRLVDSRERDMEGQD